METSKFQKGLSAILNTIEKIVIAIDTVLLLAITLIIVFQVIVRYLGISIIGTEEMSRYSYVWFAFLAWPIAALRGTDISITFLFDRLQAQVRQYLLGFYHCLMAVFASICFRSALANVENNIGICAANNQWFYMDWLYRGVAIGLFMTIIFNLIRAVRLWTKIDVYHSQEERDLMELEAALKDQEEALAAQEMKSGS